ncbi:hypothetical protein KSP39_PZI020923 [Platanthera zijinensis]|uniref:Uncharacterized protein n=1 Tax=Platanthera zijinensis TaxID=2320716 RepID=A0AAP0FWL8_9ASPA
MRPPFGFRRSCPQALQQIDHIHRVVEVVFRLARFLPNRARKHIGNRRKRRLAPRRGARDRLKHIFVGPIVPDAQNEVRRFPSTRHGGDEIPHAYALAYSLLAPPHT